MLLIKNGRVIDPASNTDAVRDVLLDGEKIKEVGPPGKIAAPQDVEVFDATGLIVAPGFIDLHVHLREPGQESSETIETGTRAAARGGHFDTPRPARDAGGGGIGLCGTRCTARRAYRSARAHRASLREVVSRAGSLGKITRAARHLRGYAASLHTHR